MSPHADADAGRGTATTHTEIYRRFEGQLQPARPAFVPLYRARLRLAFKHKLPLLLLFVPPWITGIVFSFVVYARFAVESEIDAPGDMAIATRLAVAWAKQMLEVHQQIIMFTSVSRFFALLVIAWFGAGLICEDRRAGAHLLYFSRPLTRRDYFLAHLATACTFGAIVVVGPALLICLVAVFSSPDYAFLTEKWNVLLGTIAFTTLNVLVTSLIVLAVSSVSARKTYALAGVFGVCLGSSALGRVMSRMQRDQDFAMLSLFDNSSRLADWLLDATDARWQWNPWWTAAILGGVSVASLALVAWRLRRMEVVA